MTLEQLRGDEPRLAGPAVWGIHQHMDNREIEPRFQDFKFLPEGD